MTSQLIICLIICAITVAFYIYGKFPMAVAAGFNKTQSVKNVAAGLNRFARGNLTKIMCGYVLVAILLSQFIQSPVVVFGILAPLLAQTVEAIGVKPSKVMFSLGVASVATCSAFPLY